MNSMKIYKCECGQDIFFRPSARNVCLFCGRVKTTKKAKKPAKVVAIKGKTGKVAKKRRDSGDPTDSYHVPKNYQCWKQRHYTYTKENPYQDVNE